MSGSKEIIVRSVRREDRDGWFALRVALWPDSPGSEVDGYFETGRFDGFERCAVLVAETSAGLVGFAEVSARPYAEGCETTPVGYLEGWYVTPDWQRRGVGRMLVRAAEDWARSEGLKEFASDALVENELSRKAHAALGFSEVEEIVCFARKL